MEANVQNAQAVCIPLSQASLSQLGVGMIWYDDDTVSLDLISGKQVKAVVLAVQDGIVYGDTFIEDQKSGKEISDFVNSYQKQFQPKETVCQLTFREMAQVVPHLDRINEVLARLEKPVWMGSYVTSTECACYRYWVYDMPKGVLRSDHCANAKVRIIVKHEVS